jgi:hypothetical protein
VRTAIASRVSSMSGISSRRRCGVVMAQFKRVYSAPMSEYQRWRHPMGNGSALRAHLFCIVRFNSPKMWYVLASSASGYRN